MNIRRGLKHQIHAAHSRDSALQIQGATGSTSCGLKILGKITSAFDVYEPFSLSLFSEQYSTIATYGVTRKP